MSDLLIVELSVKEIERFAQELIRLIEPLSQEQLWTEKYGIPNSIGKLLRHLTGNLNHYFGAGILKNSYIILHPYTTPCGENYESFAYHVVRLATHFALHLGQVDYAINMIQTR